MARGFHDKETRARGTLFRKTTQRTELSNNVPRSPSLFSCSFHTTTKPNYEEGCHEENTHAHTWNASTRQKLQKTNLLLYNHVLLTVHSNVTTSQPATRPTAKVEKVRRPTILSAGSSEEWSYFLTRRKDYSETTKLKGKDMVIQLLICCEEQLQKDLKRNAGGSLTNKSVDEVMAAIKKLAEREENTMVARVQLHNMRQDRDETICSFHAHLRGQASICKFLIKCPGCDADVNYTENILCDVVTRGLADSEIQLDLLGEKNQDMQLEEVFQFIEAKEARKNSAGCLLETQGEVPPTVNIAAANKRTSRTTKFTTKMKHALTVEKEAMAKIPALKQQRMTAPHMERLVPTAVIPTTSKLYAAARPRQTSRFLPHQMPPTEKLRMLSLTPSALLLISARPEMAVRYT